MTLRAKLIATFGTTLVLSILVFGSITYMSFFRDRTSDKEEILRLQDEAALLAVRSETEQALNDLLLAPRPAARAGDGLMKLVEISAWPPAGSQEPFQRLAGQLGSTGSNPEILRAKGREYLLWHRGGRDRPQQLVVTEFVADGLRSLLERHLRFDHTLLQVRQRGEVLYVFNRLDAHHQAQLSAATDFLNQASPERGRLLAGDDFYLYVPAQDVLGLQLRYLVPKADLLQSAIDFKNRIVTALIGLTWVAVWVVLILAYRITRPLGVLDQAARDIISYNYETPLELSGGSREVRSLAASFETMRRKIKDLVVNDSLTGLYNRRYLMHALELAVARSERNHEPLACLMMDMDHFKEINDRFGHQGGDAVLCEFGRIVRASCRNYDLAARYGGEEFTLVLPKTDLSTALQVAERLRQEVDKRRFSFRGQDIACTISLGITCFEGEGDSPERMLDRADRALFAAKRQGRNRIATL